MGNYLITGAAGFIGACTSEMLINDGHTVVGVDNMNNAYDLRMKEYRLKRLQVLAGFDFHKLDISEKTIVDHFKGEKFDGVINLAAWAGVRASVKNPWIYVDSNMTGTLNCWSYVVIRVPGNLSWHPHRASMERILRTRHPKQPPAVTAPAICSQQKGG